MTHPTLGKIDRDEALDRTYIPLPGGWEIQTKGKGSTFRICDPKGDRTPVLDSAIHDLLERMGRDILGEAEQLHIESARLRRERLNEQAEAAQLRAQVAALEAEVARLKEPVALVWANHNDEKKSQEIDGHWYEVRISLWGGFYPVFCDALSTQTVNGVLNAGAESLAIAACAAHHLARYREMQGAPC